MQQHTQMFIQTLLKYLAGAVILGMWMYLVLIKLAPAGTIINAFLLIFGALGIHTFTQGNKNASETIQSAQVTPEDKPQ
jgi:hypothetical protein